MNLSIIILMIKAAGKKCESYICFNERRAALRKKEKIIQEARELANRRLWY